MSWKWTANDRVEWNEFKRDYNRWKNKLDERNKMRDDWIDLLACEFFPCGDDGQPIYNANGRLPENSNLELLEDRLNGIVSLLGINEVPELVDDHDQLINADNEHLNQSEDRQPMGGGRTRRRRRKKRTRRKGGARTKKNTKYFTDPKTLKKVINPSFVPQPVTLNISGLGPVTFDPKEVAQQRRMMTQHKKLSPTGRKNRGGRRKKRTRRRKSRRRMRGKRKGKSRRKRRR